MSVSKSKSPYQSVLIPDLSEDVVKLIVRELKFPEMRSLASVNKSLRGYLKESWDLDKKIISHAVKSLVSHYPPFVRLINRVERMATFAKIDQIDSFVHQSKLKLIEKAYCQDLENSRSWIVTSTLLSANTGIQFKDGLQKKLLCVEGWNPVSQRDIEAIDSLIDFSSNRRIPGEIHFKEIIDTIAVFPNRAKAYGFIRLISHLCWYQEFDKDFGVFWKSDDESNRNYFIANASKLLPDQWNSWIADFKGMRFICKDLSEQYFSFIAAIQVCIRNLGSDASEFGLALLKLLLSRVEHLEADRRTWKCLKKQLTKEKALNQLDAMRKILETVFCWGMTDQDALLACKDILCGSKFLTKTEWNKFMKNRRNH